MMRGMKKLFAILLGLTLCVVTTGGVSVAQAQPASGDAALSAGDWTNLARRYPYPYVSGDVADAPKPEVLASWWEALEDDTLTELIMWSLWNNRDLQSARAKVMEARASLGIDKAAVLPWLDSVDSWSRGKTPVNSTGDGKSRELYRLGIDASWEIDIFGGRRETIKAGAASLEAQHASLYAAWVTLSSEVALNYLTLRTLQERLDIAQRNLGLQTETLGLIQSRYDVGLTDALALSQAQYTVEQTRSTIPPVRSSIEETTNVLSILVGSVPGSLGEMLGEKKNLPRPECVNLVGIPANYLRQRPDIRAAERQLVAQIARKKSAEKDLLPKFHLLGSIGLESLNSGSLFSSDSYSYSFGPKISWPIFHGGAIRNNIRVQSAREEQYLAAYESVVLNAVAEVRNALTANTQERVRNDALRSGVEAAQTAVNVATDKYINGLTDFSNVINAQRSLLALQDDYVVSEGQVTSNIVRIFKALGGGWAPLAEENQAESAAAKP